MSRELSPVALNVEHLLNFSSSLRELTSRGLATRGVPPPCPKLLKLRSAAPPALCTRLILSYGESRGLVSAMYSI